MCFSANLKKCISGLALAGIVAWVAGCADTSSTPMPKPTPSTSSGTPSPENSAKPVAKPEDSADNGESSTSKGTESAAGSDIDADKGREVPEAAPPTEDDDAKPTEEKPDGEKSE